MVFYFLVHFRPQTPSKIGGNLCKLPNHCANCYRRHKKKKGSRVYAKQLGAINLRKNTFMYKEITTSRFKNRKSIVSYQVIHLISMFWIQSKYRVKSEIRKGLLWQVFHLVDFVVPLHKTQITMVFTSSRYRGLIRKDQFESVCFWRATYFICTDAERIITWSFLALRGHSITIWTRWDGYVVQNVPILAHVQGENVQVVVGRLSKKGKFMSM